MSEDEMVFEEISYREPHRLRRPDLDRRMACIDYQTPAAEDLPIFLDRGPADRIERHALRDVSVELGGILLGKECVDDETGRTFVWVTEALEAKHYENTQASFTYTHDSWQEITRERDAKHPDLDIVGWYHTHPDFGVFLSSHDLFIHHNFFAQPLQVAYVVDPIRQTRAFFRWREDAMVQVGGFTLTAPRPERAALARLVNELEGIPTADGGGGGGGLSPVLEAELLAMIHQPRTVAAVPDRGQSAALYMLLGMILTSILFGGGFLLQGMARTMQDQARAIDDLTKAQEKAAAATSASRNTERADARASAFESILRDLKIDPNATPDLAVKLTEAIAQRDAVAKEVSRLRIEKDAMTDRAASNQEASREAAARADAARKELARLEKDSQIETEKLTAELREMKSDLDLNTKLVKDTASGDLLRRYTWAFYLAVAGWLGFLACGVGLAVVSSKTPGEDGSMGRSTLNIS